MYFWFVPVVTAYLDFTTFPKGLLGTDYHLVEYGVLLSDSEQNAGLAYTTTLKMGAARSSETSVNVYQNIRRCIPNYRTLHSHMGKNLKSHD
jgi:hypothetical protein